MIKYSITISMLVLFSLSVPAKTKNKTEDAAAEAVVDKIYSVEKSSPEIQIGPVHDSDMTQNNKRPLISYWHLAIERSSLSYNLPAIGGGTPSFSPTTVGVELGRKFDDRVFTHRGSFEASLEWQRFEREKSSGNTSYKQNLDIYQLNFYQNFNMGRPITRDGLLMTAGAGVAPVYISSAQNVFTNAISNVGFVGMLKMDFLIPINKMINWKKDFAFDLGLKTAWGRVGGLNLSTSTISLGIDFE